MIKLQGKCKLVLAFVAAAAMLGTAWAAGVSYDSGESIKLGDIESGRVLYPSANGNNTITFTGTEGGETADKLSSKDFFVYGASGDVTGDSSLTVDWQAKLGTKNKVQFFAGGDGGNVSGNSSLTVNAADGSSLYADGGIPNYQQSIILAGSPNGGVVKGNTKLTISGALSGKSNYLKASGAAMIDKVGSLTVEGDSTAEIYASCEDDCGFGANGGLHIVANNGETAKGVLKGKATLIVDNPNARVEQIWGGNNSVTNKGSTYAETGSVEVYLRQGKVGAVTAGPSSWGDKGNSKYADAVVSKDVYVEVTSADFGADAEFFSPYLGGGGVSFGGSAVVKGSTSVVVKGGNGIDIMVGGGLGRNKGQADVEGDTRITVKGNSGLKALTEEAWIIAGGKRDSTGSSAAVGGNATVIFSDINSGIFKGTITGQGVERDENDKNKRIYDKNIADNFNYLDSVFGDSVLVFDNVRADFSGATIVEMDRIELTSGTELKLADLGGATAIELTGNWTNLGTPSALTLTKAVDKVPEVYFREDTGIVSAVFNEAKTELVVTCKNAPIAVTPTALKLQLGKSDTVKATTPVAGEDVTWNSSDETVATVDRDGKVTAHKAGIAVISATGSVTKTTAGCTVTVEDPAAPDPVPTPAPVTPTVITEKDNPVTKDKDVPADVKPATPVIKPATEENTKALAASADVPVKFFTATADGNITVDPVIAKKTVASVMSDDAAVAPKTIVTLPIITATISDGKVAALAMKTTGAQLGAAANNIVSDITLIKILKDETGAKFGYTAEPSGYADQSFTLKNADGNNLAFTDKIDPAATYTLILFVKDNGEFDYDNTTGSVIDPVAMAMNEAKAPKPSGGSSSGCSAGVGILALLALLPLAAARRKR